MYFHCFQNIICLFLINLSVLVDNVVPILTLLQHLQCDELTSRLSFSSYWGDGALPHGTQLELLGAPNSTCVELVHSPHTSVDHRWGRPPVTKKAYILYKVIRALIFIPKVARKYIEALNFIFWTKLWYKKCLWMQLIKKSNYSTYLYSQWYYKSMHFFLAERHRLGKKFHDF